MKDFSIGELFKNAWNDFKKYWKVLIGAFAVILVINIVGTFLQNWLYDQNAAFVGSLLALVLLVVQLALSVGLIKIAIGAVDGKSVKVDWLWNSISDFRLLAFYLITSFIVGIATGVGFLLLVIPGIIIMVKLAFSLYFVVDKGQSPINAIKSSWDKTKGLFLKLFIFYVIVVVVNAIAAMLFALPLLITVPVTLLSVARLYRKLS